MAQPSSTELTRSIVNIRHLEPEVYVRRDILKRQTKEQIENFPFLTDIHPNIYKSSEAGALQVANREDFLRYESLLNAATGVVLEFKSFIGNLVDTLDPDKAEYDLLPYLAPIVGIDFNYDIPEDRARAEIANAVYLWRQKGTNENIVQWIQFVTGFKARIREYYREVLTTNVYRDVDERGLGGHHVTNTWAGTVDQLPFYHISDLPDQTYGTYGFTESATVDNIPVDSESTTHWVVQLSGPSNIVLKGRPVKITAWLSGNGGEEDADGQYKWNEPYQDLEYLEIPITLKSGTSEIRGLFIPIRKDTKKGSIFLSSRQYSGTDNNDIFTVELSLPRESQVVAGEQSSVRVVVSDQPFLTRDRLGIQVDIPDESLNRTWYGTPFLNVFLNKIERILDSIVLFGTNPILLYRLITDERLSYFIDTPFLQEKFDYSVIGDQNNSVVTGDGSHMISKIITTDEEAFRVDGGYLITNELPRTLNGHRDGNEKENSWFSYHYLGALSYQSQYLAEEGVGEDMRVIRHDTNYIQDLTDNSVMSISLEDVTSGEAYLHSLRVSTIDSIPKDNRLSQGSEHARGVISDYIEISLEDKLEHVLVEDDFELEEEN